MYEQINTFLGSEKLTAEEIRNVDDMNCLKLSESKKNQVGNSCAAFKSLHDEEKPARQEVLKSLAENS